MNMSLRDRISRANQPMIYSVPRRYSSLGRTRGEQKVEERDQVVTGDTLVKGERGVNSLSVKNEIKIF